MKHHKQGVRLNPRLFRIFSGIAIVAMLAFVGVIVAQTLKKDGSNFEPHDPILESTKKSPDYPILIEQDQDAPLKIVEASVKEISAADYQKLTSTSTNEQSVLSVPTVKMTNTSDKIVTGVMLNILDGASDRGRGLYIRELSIKPGETYSIAPGNFVKQETKSFVGENSSVATVIKDPIRSSRAWLAFTDKSKVKVRIAAEFADGTKWFNQDQR